MTSLKFAVFVSVICLVKAFNEDDLTLENGWQKTSTTLTQTRVLDGSMEEVAYINITVVTWNSTQDSSKLVSDTVRRHFSSIPVDPEFQSNPSVVYEGPETKLPLTFNMSTVEVVSYGPSTPRHVGIELEIQVYAKKQHSQQILGSLRRSSPTM